MKIAYNPETEAALTTAPSNSDITFDLKGIAIYAKGVKFKGTDTTYSVFKKHTSDNKGGYNGLVPVPSYTTTTTRYLKEDGTWDTPNYKVWTAYAGVDYIGWVTLVEWKMSKLNSFSPKPFMFSIYRNYTSPASESYTFSITSGYDTATITLISGNARARIIEQIRIVKCEDAVTYKLEMFVDEACTTYKNTCTCIVYGYSDFIGTTTCVKNKDNNVTVLTQIPTVSGKLVGTITNADCANTLNYIKLPSCGDKTSNSVWCKFAKLTFNRVSYDCVSGYLFFSGAESSDNKGILYYLFRCLKETDKIGIGSLQWLVKSNSSIEVIAKEIGPCVYNLYINNLNPWTTPIIHNLASIGAFTWDVGEWGSKPEVNYTSTDIGRVNYSNESLKLNRTIETDVSSCYEDLKLKYYTLSGCSSSISTDGKRYAGTANSYGFPVSNNANSMLWLGSHSGNFGHLLGFSSNGRIYDRYISDGSFSTIANGGSWNKIAWTHEIPTKISQLTNDSGYLTSDDLSNYVTLNTTLTITGLKTFESNSNTIGVSLILKNKGWKGGMSTAIDFYNGNLYTVPNARIETKMLDDGRNGGTLIFYTQEKHAETNPNPNNLTERFRIGDNGVSKITGLLTINGSLNLAGNNYHYKDKCGINMNNSDIIGVNSIVTLDLAESGNEGIKFYRDATHVDSLWAQNGNLYFNQNMEVTSDGCVNGTNRTVIHSGNIGSLSVNYATSANYSRNLLGRKTSGDDYDAVAGNLIFAEWNTHNDNRWYLKAEGYETRVAYATLTSQLNSTNKEAKTAYSTSTYVQWFTSSSTNPGNAGYAGDSTGFPVNNNANGILWMGTHSGPYGGLLGISSNGRMYYRFISNNDFPTTESGGSWNKIAWTSDILPINAYNYTNGCLVKLNISYDSNSMVSVHITGNAYSTAMNTKVINSIVEFYNYKDGNDILNYNATHFGYNFGDITIFNYDNKVCLWFKQDHNYMSFSVFANYTNSGSADNKVLSISNLAMPTSGVTRSKTITPKTIAYKSEIPTVTNYYWANIQVSSSSSTETTPTFKTATVTASVTTPLVNSTGRLTLNATNTGLDLKFGNDNTKSVILNGTAFKPFDDATGKLSLGTSNARWNALYSGNGNFTGDVTLYAASGDFPHLVFQRGNLYDGTYDWDQYVTGGTFKIRYNPSLSSAATWTDVLSMYPSMITTPWDITAAGFIKKGSSDSYVLLGGGGHKALADFLLESEFEEKELTSNIKSISKSLKVTSAWMDTGIKYTDLPANGSYIVQVSAHNSTDDIWYCYWTGVMSWYKDGTNDSDADEILLHRAGHAYGHTIYLRTIMTAKSDGRHLRLQIAADTNLSTAVTYTFKFKRII